MNTMLKVTMIEATRAAARVLIEVFIWLSLRVCTEVRCRWNELSAPAPLSVLKRHETLP